MDVQLKLTKQYRIHRDQTDVGTVNDTHTGPDTGTNTDTGAAAVAATNTDADMTNHVPD